MASALPVVTSAYHTFLSLFTYNKANFLYDRNQRVNRVFTGISYKLQEFGLYRQDIRDLTGLTTNTTTQYHLVTVLELGMCVTLLGPARLPEDVPEWVLWHQLVALVNAFMLLACSMWLATRAAITAESLNVRLQTQYVRLPFPDGKTLDSAITKAEEFEGADLKDMVRVPFVKATVQRVTGYAPEEDLDRKKKKHSLRKKPSLKSLGVREGIEGPRPLVSESHLLLYRQLQKHWQGFDAYARVTMSVGTYWLILSLAYYKIGWTLCHHRAGLVAGGTAALFASVVVLLMYIDLQINKRELALTVFLIYAGPVLVSIGAARSVAVDSVVVSTLWEAVAAGIAHALLTLWMWYLGLTVPGDVELPTRFLGVQYLDIFSPMIHEIRKHLGHAPVSNAVQNTRNTLRKKFRHFTGVDHALGTTNTKRIEGARARLAAAVTESTNASRVRRIQLLGDAVWVASEAGVTYGDSEMREAHCLLKRLEALVALRGMRGTLSTWARNSSQRWLGAAQASQLETLRDDVDLRISQLESCAPRSGEVDSSASDADAEGSMGLSVQRHAGSGSHSSEVYRTGSDEYEVKEDTTADRSAGSFSNVAQQCEELLARADGLIFNVGSILKSESNSKLTRQKSNSFTRQSSKVSLDSLVSECSSQSSISHLQNLVQHATEPLHRRHAENNFYRTLAMDMPKNMYNMLSGVMLLVWVTGAVVHFTRMDAGVEALYIQPGRLLQKAEPGRFLGRRLDVHTDVVERSLSIAWPEPFFRPTGLHCIEESDAQPARFLVSNNYLVYKVAQGRDAAAKPLTCPVPRHESIVAAQCTEGGACNAVVAAQGALYKCTAAGAESRDSAEPLAALPPEWLQGQGKVALQAWVAVDSNVTRIFAAPQRGPIIELRRTGNMLQPIAELPLPRHTSASIEWSSLSIQGDKLLAMTQAAPLVFAWSLATGEELGFWQLPVLPSTVWCGSTRSTAQELFGLSTAPLTPRTAVYVKASLPSRLSAA